MGRVPQMGAIPQMGVIWSIFRHFSTNGHVLKIDSYKWADFETGNVLVITFTCTDNCLTVRN